jgi:sec-independent protein translocase protein TatA
MLDFIEKPGFVIVLLVALVVFGAKRLPDSARALGRSMRILKAEAKGLKEDDKPTATVETQALPPGTTQPVTPAAEQTQQHQP